MTVTVTSSAYYIRRHVKSRSLIPDYTLLPTIGTQPHCLMYRDLYYPQLAVPQEGGKLKNCLPVELLLLDSGPDGIRSPFRLFGALVRVVGQVLQGFDHDFLQDFLHSFRIEGIIRTQFVGVRKSRRLKSLPRSRTARMNFLTLPRSLSELSS